MSYATLMLHLELGRSNAALLDLAVDLAERFQAGVIGVTACKPAAFVAGDGYMDGALIDAEYRQLALQCHPDKASPADADAGVFTS